MVLQPEEIDQGTDWETLMVVEAAAENGERESPGGTYFQQGISLIEGQRSMTREETAQVRRIETGTSMREKLEQRKLFRRVDVGDCAVTMAAIEERTAKAWSENTTASYGSTWNIYQFYAQQLPRGIPQQIAIMMLLEEMMSQGFIGIGTALRYSIRLGGLLKLFNADEENDTPGQEKGLNKWLAMWRRALRLQGAMHPIHQAPPITRRELDEVMRTLPPFERAELLLLWLTASRLSDFSEVLTNHWKVISETADETVFSVKYERTKGDPFHEGAALQFTAKGMDREILRNHRNSLIPASQIIQMTYARLMQILEPHGFTEHSIKRGALTAMMMAGVSAETLRVIAKHRSLKTLFTYLEIEHAIEKFYHTSAATAALGPV